jgi:protein-S-isoprenylcysteine O-methyltransferase Ste14
MKAAPRLEGSTISEDIDMSANTSVEQVERKSETTRGVVRWLIREVIGVLFVAATLFISAGRLDWVWGWALVGIYAIWVGANALILIPTSPELLAERAARRKGIKGWDTAILSTIGLATMAKYILAGLDVRFGWTAQMPLALHMVALVIAALGYAVGTWAMAANAFFSLVVRIQEDRGHAVATGGPYRYVRHPGYTGSVAFELATPIMLGSVWALIPGGLNALLTVVRTALEDKTLHEELPGYAEYAQQTRYHLLPGIW